MQVVSIVTCTLGAVAVIAAMVRPNLDQLLSRNMMGVATGLSGFFVAMFSIAAFATFTPAPKTYTERSKEVYDTGRDAATRTLQEGRKKTEDALKDMRKSADDAWRWTKERMPDTPSWWPWAAEKEPAPIPPPVPQEKTPEPPRTQPWWQWGQAPKEPPKK